nr:hypothetical protein [Tanacetum cinerariifolium]
MHQFWNTIKKIGKTDGYNFKLDKKKCRVDTKVFCKILQICPRIPNQDFVELPSEEDLLTFIKELGYSGKCDMLSTIQTDQMLQPWRTFASVINMCISRKSTGLDRLIKSRTLKFVSKIEDYQIYGASIPDGIINDDIKLSKAYKTYLDYATGKVPPKKARKFKKHASPKLKTVPASPKEPTQKGKRVKRATKKATTAPTTSVVIKDTSYKSVSKKKATAKTGRGKGIELLLNATLLKEAQMKKALKKSKRQTHNLQASSSSEGADFKSDVSDEPTGKTKDTSKGTGVKPGVPDVSKDDSSDSNNDSWGDSEDESDDDHDEDDNDDEDDDGNNEDSEKMFEEEDDDVTKELYGDLNITQGLIDTDLTNAQQGGKDQLKASHESGSVQEEEDAHVTLTIVHDKTEGPLQSSSISSGITSKLLNLDDPSLDINSLMNNSTIPPPPPPVNPFSHPTTIPQQQTPDSITTTYPTMTLPEIPNFASLF